MGGRYGVDDDAAQVDRKTDRNRLRTDEQSSQQITAILQPFQHQVGGHVALLSWDVYHVCKPFTERESSFYRRMPNSLAKFVPNFCGTIEVSLEPDDVGYLTVKAKPKVTSMDNLACFKCLTTNRKILYGYAGHPAKYRFRLKKCGRLDVESVEQSSSRIDMFRDVSSGKQNAQNPWAFYCQTKLVDAMRKSLPNHGKHYFMLLENLVSRFEHPCIIDLKLGTRQHGDDASREKRQVQKSKCKQSTSARLGVRLVGMQVYDASDGIYHCTNKYYGRELDSDGFHKQIRRFLADDGVPRNMLCKAFIRRLKQLFEVISTAEGHRFFSASLLLMYDAAGAAPETERASDEAVDVRMIDFEHATFPGFRSDTVYTGHDQGYLLGLRTLLHSISTLIHLQ